MPRLNMTFDRERSNCIIKRSTQERERFRYRKLPVVSDSGHFSGQKHVPRERFAVVSVQLCNFWVRAYKMLGRVSTNSRVWLIGAFGIFTVYLFYLFEVQYADDPWISFRYARNLVNGYGFVFNPGGEIVEGYTNFLWVIITACFMKLRFHPLVATKLLGVGLAYLSLYLLYKIAQSFDLPASFWHAIPIALVGLMAPYVIWIVSGMESALTSFLIVAVVYIHINWRGQRRLLTEGVLLTLLLLDRLDGITVVFVVVLDLIIDWWRSEERKYWDIVIRLLWLCLPLLTIILPYFIWRLAYFGYLAPNTYYAKVSGIPLLSRLLRGTTYTAYFAIYWAAIPLFLTVLYLVLKGWPRKPLRFCYGLVVVRMLYSLHVGGDVLPHFRFFVPIIPILTLIATVALGEVSKTFMRNRAAMFRVGTMLVSIMCLVSFGSLQVTRITHDGTFDLQAKLNIGKEPRCSYCEWLRRYAPPGSSIALFAAGYIPYWTLDKWK